MYRLNKRWPSSGKCQKNLVSLPACSLRLHNILFWRCFITSVTRNSLRRLTSTASGLRNTKQFRQWNRLALIIMIFSLSCLIYPENWMKICSSFVHYVANRHGFSHKNRKIILYLNILKMFHILLCTMSDLSWKFRECIFLSNAAKEQMKGQMHGQADEDEEKDRLTENEILPSLFGGSNYWYWSFLHWNRVFWDLPIFGIHLYSAGSPEKLDALLLLHFHPYLSWAVFIKCCDVIRAALCWLCLVKVYWGHELSIIVKLSLWNMPMVRLIFFSFCSLVDS